MRTKYTLPIEKPMLTHSPQGIDIESYLIRLGLRKFGKGNNTYYIKTKTVFLVHLLSNKIVITKDVKLPDGNEANTNVFEGVVSGNLEIRRVLEQVGCL